MASNIVCEKLKDSDRHRELLRNFYVSKETGQGLYAYLEHDAWEDQKDNRNKTYLVIDTKLDTLVGYFTLKVGSVLFSNSKSWIKRDYKEFLPGIEIGHLAVNSGYKDISSSIEYIGDFILREFAFPVVKSVSEIVGVSIVYIYALPYKKLVNYYSEIGFRRIHSKTLEKQVYRYSKPGYDNSCIFMYMPVSSLKK